MHCLQRSFESKVYPGLHTVQWKRTWLPTFYAFWQLEGNWSGI